MTTTIVCTACDLALDEPKGPCPRCGGTVCVSVRPTGQAAQASAGAVGALVDEVRETHHALQYASPSGVCSKIKIVGDDRVDMQIAPRSSHRLDVGREGEDRVADRVRAQLASEGRTVIVGPGDDARGVDRVLVVDGDPIPLQIITVPNKASLWLPRGGDESFDARAVDLIHEAATSKARKYAAGQRDAMILALDVVHAGLLAEHATAAAYLQKYRDPRAEFGFGSVWLVGPIEKYCRRLGTSRW
jgi:hypothetical protein